MSLSYNYPSQMAYPSAPPAFRSLPAPPRLHWGIVLALSFFTSGIFGVIWMVIQANWLKKATKNGKPFAWALAHLISLGAIFVILFVGGLMTALMGASGTQTASEFVGILTVVVQLSSVVIYIVAAFTLKGALEERPIDIPLSGVMTFFFAPTYFQYHLFDYSVEGKVGEQLSGFAEPAVVSAPASALEAQGASPQA